MRRKSADQVERRVIALLELECGAARKMETP